MSAPTRIYQVRIDGQKPRLIRAATMARAVSFVAESLLTATVAKQDDLVSLIGDGVKVEDASTAE